MFLFYLGFQQLYKLPLTYDIPDWMSFDGVLCSQREAAEDDEDEDEVGEVRMINEVVTGHSEAGRTWNGSREENWRLLRAKHLHCDIVIIDVAIRTLAY